MLDTFDMLCLSAAASPTEETADWTHPSEWDPEEWTYAPECDDTIPAVSEEWMKAPEWPLPSELELETLQLSDSYVLPSCYQEGGFRVYHKESDHYNGDIMDAKEFKAAVTAVCAGIPAIGKAPPMTAQGGFTPVTLNETFAMMKAMAREMQTSLSSS